MYPCDCQGCPSLADIEFSDCPSPGSPLYKAGRRGTMAIHKLTSLYVVEEPPDRARALRRLLELVEFNRTNRITITGGSIDWHEGFGNRPNLRLTLAGQFPALSEFRFKNKGRLWYAELDGAAAYFAWGGATNEGGFGGNEFDITMENGETVTLRGPWSSGTYAVNAAGFSPVIDVMTTEADGGHARDLTVAFVRRYLGRVEPTPFEGKPFPDGSKVELVKRTLVRPGDIHEPAIRLPDGKLWMKPELGK